MIKAILIITAVAIITFGAIQYAHADWRDNSNTLGQGVGEISHNIGHMLEYLNWILKEEIKQTKLLEDANCISYNSIGMFSPVKVDRKCNLDYEWAK